MKPSSVITHAHKVHAEEVTIERQVPSSIAFHVTALGQDIRESRAGLAGFTWVLGI